jgi:hypothetical protein
MEVDTHIRQAEYKQGRIQSFAFVISVCVCVLLCVYLSSSGFGRPAQPYKMELDERINPNVAPPASLIRLPGIGAGRAEAIVAFRKGFSRADANTPVFRNGADLQKVKGIGPKTVQDVSEWLKFE